MVLGWSIFAGGGITRSFYLENIIDCIDADLKRDGRIIRHPQGATSGSAYGIFRSGVWCWICHGAAILPRIYVWPDRSRANLNRTDRYLDGSV